MVNKEIQAMKEKLLEIKKTYDDGKDEIQLESDTKQHLILPFISMLGYNIHSPKEITTEYITNTKNDRVDYIIKMDNKPIMIVECKKLSEDLSNEKFKDQLRGYFSDVFANHKISTIGILTNGKEYLFFTDAEYLNAMDNESFFKFNISKHADDDIQMLTWFSKQNFNLQNIKSNIQGKNIQSKIKNYLTKQFSNPDDKFANFVLQEIDIKSDVENTKDIIKQVFAGMKNNENNDEINDVEIKQTNDENQQKYGEEYIKNEYSELTHKLVCEFVNIAKDIADKIKFNYTKDYASISIKNSEDNFQIITEIYYQPKSMRIYAKLKEIDIESVKNIFKLEKNPCFNKAGSNYSIKSYQSVWQIQDDKEKIKQLVKMSCESIK